MHSHQESSHARYTSCQLKGCIRVINYIRILVRTFDWHLAKGHFRTSMTKDRYKCDPGEKLKNWKWDKRNDQINFQTWKMWQFRIGFPKQMIRHHYVSVSVGGGGTKQNSFSQQTDNSLCYLRIISHDPKAHRVPTVSFCSQAEPLCLSDPFF